MPDKETAFPVPLAIDTTGDALMPHDEHQGLSVRDYFAAKAMQGMLAATDTVSSSVAENAYWMADAMMEARK